MNFGLRWGLAIASIAVLIVIIIAVKKRKLNIKYSVVWILWAILSMLMAIFPESFYALSHFLGIELPVNAVFLIMIALVYALTFHIYCTITKHNEEIITLTYEIAKLKKEVEELKRDKNNK